METQEIIKKEIITPTKAVGSSKNFKIIIGIVGAMLVAVVIFASGVVVGLHKARFSYQWGQNYERNFMGSGFGPGNMMGNRGNDFGRGDDRGGMMGGFFRSAEGKDFRNAHGLAGVVVSIADNNIIVKDRDNKENTIAVSDKTIIKRNADDLKIVDLKAGDQLVVMGTPNDQGVISADLVRVFNSATRN